MNLNNKTIVITGGARGIGREMALAYKKCGANVAVCSRTQADLDEAMREFKEIPQGDSLIMTVDVLEENQQKKFFRSVADKWGAIFGLVCGAGVYGSIGPFVETDFSQWKNGLDINLIGTAISVHSVYPYMKASGEGRIILFSGGGVGPLPNFSSYVVSKGAIWRMTETLGAELSGHGIFVNAIAPGAVNTKFLEDLLKAGPERVGSQFYQQALKQRRSGGTSPEKAVNLGLYLMAPESRGLWGKTLSAVWDEFDKFSDLEKMSQTEIFTMRRVIDDQGNTRPK